MQQKIISFFFFVFPFGSFFRLILIIILSRCVSILRRQKTMQRNSQRQHIDTLHSESITTVIHRGSECGVTSTARKCMTTSPAAGATISNKGIQGTVMMRLCNVDCVNDR